MTYLEAQALADRMNAKDAGMLHYSVLTVGSKNIVMVYDLRGRELGPL